MTRPVREVAPTSIGSGARLREFIVLPRWATVTWLLTRWFFRHYWVVFSFFLTCFVWYGYGLGGWWLAILTVVGAWVIGIASYWAWLGGRWKTLLWYLRLRRSWRHAIVNVGLKSRDNLHIPTISRVRPVTDGLKFKVNMACAGRTVNDLRAEADDVCEVLGFRRVQVFPLKPGQARMVLLATEEQVVQESEAGTIDTPDFNVLGLDDFGDHTKVAFGRTPSGDAILSLVISLLIVGLSNSGKTNLLKAVFHALLRQNIPHELYVIDDKGGVSFTELEHYPHTLAYCSRADQEGETNGPASRVIDKAYKEMWERADWMKQSGNRKIVPSNETPIRIIFIDELLLMQSQIKGGVEGKLGQILTVGREFLYVVIALSQGSQVDLLGRIRDLFPQRICLATPTLEVTEACLGKGAEGKGAKCSEIPLSMPGVGYYRNPDGRGYTRFRAAEVVGSLLTGVVGVDKRDKNKNRRCCVYKYYDISGRALRIGHTYDPEQRAKQYANSQLWWTQRDVTRDKIDWYKNKADAEAAEIHAIGLENPIHNRNNRKLSKPPTSLS